MRLPSARDSPTLRHSVSQALSVFISTLAPHSCPSAVAKISIGQSKRAVSYELMSDLQKAMRDSFLSFPRFKEKSQDPAHLVNGKFA